jgi:hypothetical protein
VIHRKKKKLKDKKESARFVELAGRVLKDGAEKDFEEAFQNIIKAKPSKK